MKKTDFYRLTFALLSNILLSACETLPKIPVVQQTTLYAPSSAIKSSAPPPTGYVQKLAHIDSLASGFRSPSALDMTCQVPVQPTDWQENLNLLLIFAVKEGLTGTLSGEKLNSKRFRNASRGLNWFPPQLETLIGEYKLKDVEALLLPREGRKNTALYEKVDTALAELLENLDQVTPHEFKVHILQSSRGLVQALPGGIILVDRNVVTDSDGIALSFKLAHEISHILQRHTTSMYQARLVDGLETIDTALNLMKDYQGQSNGDKNRNTLSTGIEAFYNVKKSFSDYSADQESNADGCAYRLLTSGKNKRKLDIKDFQALIKTFGDPTEEAESIKASEEEKFLKFITDGQFERHPSTQTRRKHLAALWKSGLDTVSHSQFDREFTKLEQSVSKQIEANRKKLPHAAARSPENIASTAQPSGFPPPQPRVASSRPMAKIRSDPDKTITQQLEQMSSQASDRKFTETATGLKIGEISFADPEGPVVSSAIQDGGGGLTYAVTTSPISASIKKVSAHDPKNPILIGRVLRTINGKAYFESAGGKKALATDIRVMDGGLVAWDGKSGYRYTPATGLLRIKFPEGWSPTKLQNGNISSTGWILLERDALSEQDAGASIFKGFAEQFRAVEANDFALFNLDDERLFILDISSSGKKTAFYSGCEDKGKLVNKCANAVSVESLWTNIGLKNASHYYWRANWFKHQGRNLMIALEASNGKMVAYDLDRSIRVTLMERMMGYPGFDIEFATDGKLHVESNMLLYKERVDDVLARFDVPQPPAIPASQNDTSSTPKAVPATLETAQ